ncbi:hypothetical protein [Novosphingobium decolorationis]|uniref:DUF2489 domain-containing protein n=1 Tax=Novosphingobium decolorationis TaxID=2698673 RepID=A0ABX8EDE8_9SPHN|nr:hypothetical protein [Novosphingobium decolorationis]QVM85821.1 hypothetical protein HT578_20825 [Novosphingobium decolorationis]
MSSDLPAWISAAGGLLSVFAASWIAISQSKRADRIEDQQAELEAVRRSRLIEDCISLAERLHSAASELIGDSAKLNKPQLRRELGVYATCVRNFSSRISQIETIDPEFRLALTRLELGSTLIYNGEPIPSPIKTSITMMSENLDVALEELRKLR